MKSPQAFPISPKAFSPNDDAPVLIVGGGPVGLLAAILLARRGVRSIVCEKYPSRLDAPKAHALNPRSLEICRAAGLPLDRIRQAATPRADGGCVRMLTSLVGAEWGVLPYERQDDGALDLTPTPLVNIAQPRFEAILEETAERLDLIEVRRNAEWKGCTQDDDAVLSEVICRRTGEVTSLRSRYLIAADGASSAVRAWINIAMIGPEVLRHHVMIHFEANLRGLVQDRPAVLYFFFGASAQGVLIAYDIDTTWVLMHPFDPEQTPLETFDKERCRQIVLEAIGADVPALNVRDARPWALSAQVAESYCRGRIFLAGDAAHRFPPTGGLGLNTGVADVDNLTWKIAACLAGEASNALLDTYQSERQHVARTNMDQSLNNAMKILAVPMALGCLGDGSDDGAQTAQRLADPEVRRSLDEAIAEQSDHFDSLRLQLGYVYGDANDDRVDNAESALSPGDFRPACVVGGRLPHVWVHRDGERLSTLDLVAVDRFSILTASANSTWDQFATGSELAMRCWAENRDFTAEQGSWSDTCGIGQSGALLLRPDGHILARALNDQAESVAALLTNLEDFLGRPTRRAEHPNGRRTGVV